MKKTYLRGISVWLSLVLLLTGIPLLTGCDTAEPPAGKSAYELAVENGYEGDLTSWLSSLVGAVGENGRDGSDGKSAYELAVEKGYEGTLNEWVASLAGETGAEGKSAYELAVEKGYEGSETEWLTSLVGPRGEKGDKGDQGEQGIQGEKGDKGDQGEQGIQGEKGDKGDQGEQGIQGEKGDKGDQGEQGIQGEKGDKGDTGADGITPLFRIHPETNQWEISYDGGDSWVSLNTPATGDKGDTGAQGEKGEKGDTGAQGEKGDKGDTGAQGDKGDTGADGKPGVGISGAHVDENMHLQITLTDGTVIDAGCVGLPEPDNSPVKNLILIIGDGMGPEHIAAGYLANPYAYDFTGWPSVNVNTDSVDASGYAGIVTDSAASSTAMATGYLTVNQYVGMDHTKTVRDTILDYASGLGKSTGFLSSEQLYGATPAGFTVHVESRLDSGSITQGQGLSGVDFLCGDRHDAHYKGKIPFLVEQGYFVSNTTEGLDDALTTAQKAYLTLDIENGEEGCISLSAATSYALSFLSRDEDGFVLVIEQAKIDKASHNMDIVAVTEYVGSLIETVETVMDWIGDRTDTAVLITADHETGGLTVSGNPTAFANTYDTGNGVISYRFVNNQHTDQQVKLFVYGREVNFKDFDFFSSHHLIKNTDIYHIMKRLLDGEAA